MSQHLVLLGDSIFDNAAYVPGGPSVIEHLRRILGGDWRATVVRDPWTQVVRGLLMRRPGAGNQVQVIVTREGRAFLAAYGRAVISKSAVQS